MNQLDELVKQAKAMQDKVRIAQDELAKIEVDGQSGGGLVKITMTCLKAARRASIDASLLSAGNKENLEDLVVAAFNDAKARADEISTATMEEATNGLKLPAGV
ncbi:MAG: YbaB/EbfC family nucleoid-associated protein [Rickettsiales bacterium]|jgi:DNA-binding YbaB/EbfC family protein|nr:YbaB/EbfC family nucleoid-associated protein [Rickettsiales bacterium]